MVENRKLFYAISMLLLNCCQIITMYPHNVEQELRAGSSSSINMSISNNSDSKNPNTNFNSSSISDNSNNSEYNRANIDSGSNQSYGSIDDFDSEFIIAVERKLQTMEAHNEKPRDVAYSQSNVGVWETSPDSITSENVDDLIFLDKRPINQHQEQSQREYVAQLPTRINEQQMMQRGHHSHFQIHHHLSADGLDSGSTSSSDENSADSLTHAASSTSSLPLPLENSDNIAKDVNADYVEVVETEADAADVETDIAIPPHEIDLLPDNNEEHTIMTAVIPLDLSDFLSLIPAERVKAIVANYYLNDPEVQRAYAFMSSQDFAELKQHIISIPEMSEFLRYLNSSGLDLVKFVTAIGSITKVPPKSTSLMQSTTNIPEKAFMSNETNDIEYAQKQRNIAAEPIPTPTIANSIPATTIEIQTHKPLPSSGKTMESTDIPLAFESEASANDDADGIGRQILPTITMTLAATVPALTTSALDMEATTTMKEQLNGLHGLVDGILDVLPQDQILATFFDKLESSEQFSKLVDNIGSPEFAKILNNMQNSIPLRNLIFTLHNNGIYIIRIVDSLKSYFFLGGF